MLREFRARPRAGFPALLLLCLSFAARAEDGVVQVCASGLDDRPIEGITVGPRGEGSGDITTVSGRARLHIPRVKPGQWISLVINSPPNILLVSPWTGRAVVPALDGPDNYVDVISISLR